MDEVLENTVTHNGGKSEVNQIRAHVCAYDAHIPAHSERGRDLFFPNNQKVELQSVEELKLTDHSSDDDC